MVYGTRRNRSRLDSGKTMRGMEGRETRGKAAIADLATRGR